MRRHDREMSEEFALEVVDKCEYAVLSMVDTSNMPYAVPITIVREGDVIYFHCAHVGEKIDCMRNNANVCVVCVGDTMRELKHFTTAFESAVVRGTASEITDDEVKIHALRLLCERHTPTNMDAFDEAIKRSLAITAIWAVKIEHITGKAKRRKSE